ncbi:MAG: hypothetical protein R6W67_01140 [Bacteroidales bacterium]
MKKTIYCIMAISMLFALNPLQGSTLTPTDPPVATVPAPVNNAEAEALVKRLEVIKGMDKKTFTKAEKKDLRVEVKEIRAKLNATGNGIYISVGGAIIVILLLILLL